MKIDVHVVTLMMKEDARSALRREARGRETEADAGRIIVPAFTEQFRRILAATENTSGIVWTPCVTWSRKEMESAGIFEIWGRRNARESSRDTMLNLETLAALPHLQTGPNLRVKLLSPIHISRARCRPIDALRVGDWAEEYLIGRAVKWAFEQRGLRGYTTRPVFGTKGRQALEDVWQICTDRILPPTVPDPSVIEVESAFEERPWWKRRLGSLTWRPESFPSGSDFWRTAEPWGANGLPLWIVTRSVVDCFEAAGLRGWSFRPALWAGSPLHQEYLDRWTALTDALSANPGNRLW